MNFWLTIELARETANIETFSANLQNGYHLVRPTLSHTCAVFAYFLVATLSIHAQTLFVFEESVLFEQTKNNTKVLNGGLNLENKVFVFIWTFAKRNFLIKDLGEKKHPKNRCFL